MSERILLICSTRLNVLQTAELYCISLILYVLLRAWHGIVDCGCDWAGILWGSRLQRSCAVLERNGYDKQFCHGDIYRWRVRHQVNNIDNSVTTTPIQSLCVWHVQCPSLQVDAVNCHWRDHTNTLCHWTTQHLRRHNPYQSTANTTDLSSTDPPCKHDILPLSISLALKLVSWFIVPCDIFHANVLIKISP